MPTYTIRKDGKVYCSWTDPSCAPNRDALKSMKSAGYRLYIDGKLQR